MSGLKRISKHVLLMEPTALHAFRTTSRLLASVVSKIQAEDDIKARSGQLTSTICHSGKTSSRAVSTVDEYPVDLQSPHYYPFSPEQSKTTLSKQKTITGNIDMQTTVSIHGQCPTNQ